MNTSELRQKTDDELREELLGMRKEQFNLRMQQATGQLGSTDQFGKVRRNIARLKTVMSERRNQAKKTEAVS